MASEAARTYLHDVSKACGLIEEFLRGKTYQEYVQRNSRWTARFLEDAA